MGVGLAGGASRVLPISLQARLVGPSSFYFGCEFFLIFFVLGFMLAFERHNVGEEAQTRYNG